MRLKVLQRREDGCTVIAAAPSAYANAYVQYGSALLSAPLPPLPLPLTAGAGVGAGAGAGAGVEVVEAAEKEEGVGVEKEVVVVVAAYNERESPKSAMRARQRSSNRM